MKSFANKVAVITGAASGIGRSLALRLASRGARLALSDIDELRLAETRRDLEAAGARELSIRRLDVSKRDDVYAWADDVIAEHGTAHYVFNNAGVALVDTVDAMTYEDHEWLMAINYWGVVYGTRAFLPHVEAAGEGRIVNISSVFGLIAVAGQSAYNSAKFAVRGFSEALAQELAMRDSPVGVTCVHPGGVTTNIVRAARFGTSSDQFGGRSRLVESFDRTTMTSPDRAADIILEGVMRGRNRVLVGKDAHVIDIIQRLLPVGYQRILAVINKRREKLIARMSES